MDGKTGALVVRQSPEALYAAMERLAGLAVTRDACIANARSFDESVFREGMLRAVEFAMARQ